MAKFRKKPIVIEAVLASIVLETDDSKKPEWILELTNDKIIIAEDALFIKTLEGVMRAELTDYIIRGINGEIYPCKPDIFEKTYEPVYNE